MTEPTFIGLRFNLLLVIDETGRLIWGGGFDLKKKKRVRVPESILKRHLPQGIRWHHASPKIHLTGILPFAEGPILLVPPGPS